MRPIGSNEKSLLQLAEQILEAQNDAPEIILRLKGRFRVGCDEKLRDAIGWFDRALLHDVDPIRAQFARYGLATLSTRAKIKELGLQAAAERDRQRIGKKEVQMSEGLVDMDEAVFGNGVEAVKDEIDGSLAVGGNVEDFSIA